MRDLDANGQSTISEIYTDAGNEFTSKEFHEECGKRHIRVLNMPPGEPSPRVERYVRTLRTRVAVIIASLGYKLPITLLSYVHEYAAQINNFLPSEASGSHTSPYRIYTGARMPWSNMVKMRFGQLAVAENIRARGSFVDGVKVGYGELVIVMSFDPKASDGRKLLICAAYSCT